MPRRWPVDRTICHVYNRAAGRLRLFKTASDYRCFLGILLKTKRQFPSLKLYGYCVMPNHWHLVICVPSTTDLSEFMKYLTHRHAVAHIAGHRERSGAIYQGRFKCVPVQDGEHLTTLLLYVDRNPLRARLVERAEDWLWSSTIGHAGLERDGLLEDLPAGIFEGWLDLVNRLDARDAAITEAVRRRQPIGSASWQALLSPEWKEQRRPRGRPRKISRAEL